MLSSVAFLWGAAFAASTAYSTLAQSITTNGTNSTGSIPQVRLDQGTFIGARNGNVDKFLGIHYAKPTWGDLRLRLPVASDPYTGEYNVTEFGLACLQLDISEPVPDILDPQAQALLAADNNNPITQVSEDCLTVNVFKPSNVPAGKKLSVVIWIYGGGFSVGSSSAYDGSVLVQRSIDLGEPILFVSLNHRHAAYGFLHGAEVQAAGVANIGMQDQRQAFRWVQKYIGAFGGDRSKVTIWGQSSGSISVGLHLIANGGNTEGLFHAAFMESGFPNPYGDTRNGQKWYDAIVSQSGCSGSNDTLACIRDTVPNEVINAIQDHLPNFSNQATLHLTWVPRADGKFIRDIPYVAIPKGRIANVPIIVGDTDDEAPAFTIPLLNITTDEEVHAYMSSNYFPNATTAEIDHLLELYPQDPTQGSPFDTGEANAVTPQFKRLNALGIDLFFHGPRRFLLNHRANKQPAWSYLWKRFKDFPDFGSFHGSEISNFFGGGDLGDYLINFVNHHNPNGKGDTSWPQYNLATRTQLTLLDGNVTHTLTRDDFRVEGINYLNTLLAKYPL
ncbi:carotenoid ester lipase precursor [Irpex lacteus]|nr:carotenoid ester lipase precursor [Irpex lacteus]